MKVPRVQVGLNIPLMALGANVNDLLFVLLLRHHFFLRLEVGVVAGRADRIAPGVFLILLEMIALPILRGDCLVAAIADQLHAQFLLSIVRPVTLLAVGNLFLAAIFQHLVEVFHPGFAFNPMAGLTVD